MTRPSALSTGRRSSDALLRVVRSFPEPAALDWSVIDGARFVAQAEYHRVGCLLRPSLTVGSDVPAKISAYSKAANARWQFTTGRVDADLVRLHDALGTLEQPWLVVKGPALEALAYRDGRRDYRDLDLLVDGRELHAAIAAIESAGGSLLDRNFELMLAMRSGELTMQMPKGTIIDLHWQTVHTILNRRHFRIRIPDMLARAVPVAVREVEVLTLDPTDTLIFACIHACLSGADRLLWFKDIELLLSHTKWRPDLLVTRSRDARVGLVVALMLQRADSLLHLGVDHALIRQLDKHRAWQAGGAMLNRWVSPQQRERGRSDRAFFAATRTNARDSMLELLRKGVGDRRSAADAAHPWRSYPVAGNPLHQDLDSGSRANYFEAARAETQAQVRQVS